MLILSSFVASYYVGLVVYFFSNIPTDVVESGSQMRNLPGYYVAIYISGCLSALLLVLLLFDYITASKIGPRHFTVAMMISCTSKLFFATADFGFFPGTNADWVVVLLAQCLSQCFIANAIRAEDRLDYFLSFKMLVLFQISSLSNATAFVLFLTHWPNTAYFCFPLMGILYFLTFNWLFRQSAAEGYSDSEKKRIWILCGALILPNLSHVVPKIAFLAVECVNNQCSMYSAVSKPSLIIVILISSSIVYFLAVLGMRMVTEGTNSDKKDQQEFAETELQFKEMGNQWGEDEETFTTLDDEIIKMTFPDGKIPTLP